MLTGKHLSKSYHRGSQVLHDVNVSIVEGEIVGLVGESGSGKSTLARILMQLEKPEKGNVFLDGRPVSSMPKREYYRECQIVFQNASAAFNPVWTVRKILMEPLRFSRTDKEVQIHEMLEKVGLTRACLKKRPAELSGGEKQRINLLRSLLVQPRLIICDEIVSNLDRVTQKGIVDLLIELNRENGLTIFFISHDLRVINYICQRIYVLYQGEIVEESRKTNSTFTFSHPYAKKLFAAAGIEQGT